MEFRCQFASLLIVVAILAVETLKHQNDNLENEFQQISSLHESETNYLQNETEISWKEPCELNILHRVLIVTKIMTHHMTS